MWKFLMPILFLTLNAQAAANDIFTKLRIQPKYVKVFPAELKKLDPADPNIYLLSVQKLTP